MEAPDRTPQHSEERTTEEKHPRRFRRRWIALALVIILFLLMLPEIIDPFGDEPYLQISHGDHYHYVPQDRNPDVPISQFPTQQPASHEHITPDGRIVQAE